MIDPTKDGHLFLEWKEGRCQCGRVEAEHAAAKNFERALSELPQFITGLDALHHTTTDSLVGLVELQLDLKQEDDISDIRSDSQERVARRYVEKWKGKA